jgi:hypothetical protein
MSCGTGIILCPNDDDDDDILSLMSSLYSVYKMMAALDTGQYNSLLPL